MTPKLSTPKPAIVYVATEAKIPATAREAERVLADSRSYVVRNLAPSTANLAAFRSFLRTVLAEELSSLSPEVAETVLSLAGAGAGLYSRFQTVNRPERAGVLAAIVEPVEYRVGTAPAKRAPKAKPAKPEATPAE